MSGNHKYIFERRKRKDLTLKFFGNDLVVSYKNPRKDKGRDTQKVRTVASLIDLINYKKSGP